MCVSRNADYDLRRHLWSCGNRLGHQEGQGDVAGTDCDRESNRRRNFASWPIMFPIPSKVATSFALTMRGSLIVEPAASYK
jgi:hypothetical protein